MKLLHRFFILVSMIWMSLFMISESHAQEQAPRPEEPSRRDLDMEFVEEFFNHQGIVLDTNCHMPLYEEIFRWYKTPYKYAGDDYRGIDCSGYTTHLYAQIYNIQLSGGSGDIFTKVSEVDTTQLREGDLLFFVIANKRISHVGVFLQNRKFVHATTREGVIISDLDETYYKKYFYRAGRIVKEDK